MKKIMSIVYVGLIFLPLIAENWICPVVDEYVITSNTGVRDAVLDKTGKLVSDYEIHKGIDIWTGKKSPIYAAKAGIVISHYPAPNGYYKGHEIYGGCVLLYHGNGEYSLYAHMSNTEVKEGEKVVQGQLLGHIGTTGKSTGLHLHFEMFLDPYVFFEEQK